MTLHDVVGKLADYTCILHIITCNEPIYHGGQTLAELSIKLQLQNYNHSSKNSETFKSDMNQAATPITITNLNHKTYQDNQTTQQKPNNKHTNPAQDH